MRTITYDVYHYDELSESARVNALDNARLSVGSFLNEMDADEYRFALGIIESVLGINVYDWNVGDRDTYYRWRFAECSRFAEMSDDPRYLVRYLNEVERYCRKGKYYFTYKDSTCIHRYSRILFERNYSLTGTWTCAVMDDYTGQKRWEYVREKKTIEDYIEDILHAFFNQWRDDTEYNYGDDAIENAIVGNEYEFLENGERWMN